MTQTARVHHEPDQALVHRFIRVVGRRPTPDELRRYEEARFRVSLRLPSRVRRGTARLIGRL